MKNSLKILFTSFCLIAGLSSCYYDVEEEINPPGNCDTAKVGFVKDIQPILETNCLACHSQAVAQSGVVLEGYGNAMSYAANGTLFHQVNNGQMPPAGKLPDCDISKIKKWVDDGAPNN